VPLQYLNTSRERVSRNCALFLTQLGPNLMRQHSQYGADRAGARVRSCMPSRRIRRAIEDLRLNVRRVVGMVERLILGSVMGSILFVVERLITSPGDVQRAQRVLHRITDRD
jgi:hypothetical protein